MEGKCSNCHKTHYDAEMSDYCDSCLMGENDNIVLMYDPMEQ